MTLVCENKRVLDHEIVIWPVNKQNCKISFSVEPTIFVKDAFARYQCCHYFCQLAGSALPKGRIEIGLPRDDGGTIISTVQ